MNARNLPRDKGDRCIKLTTPSPPLSRLSGKCGSLDVSQTCGPPLPATRDGFIALSFCVVEIMCYNYGKPIVREVFSVEGMLVKRKNKTETEDIKRGHESGSFCTAHKKEQHKVSYFLLQQSCNLEGMFLIFSSPISGMFGEILDSWILTRCEEPSTDSLRGR
jgi:hypothetical protein